MKVTFHISIHYASDSGKQPYRDVYKVVDLPFMPTKGMMIEDTAFAEAKEIETVDPLYLGNETTEPQTRVFLGFRDFKSEKEAADYYESITTQGDWKESAELEE